MTLRPDFHVFHPSHGPQVWPRWKLLVVRVFRCSHDPFPYFWLTPISYNIWFYTRWGAWCWSWRVRRGVYDRTTPFDRMADQTVWYHDNFRPDCVTWRDA